MVKMLQHDNRFLQHHNRYLQHHNRYSQRTDMWITVWPWSKCCSFTRSSLSWCSTVCCRGVTVVLLWYSTVCHSGVTVVSERCFGCVTMVVQGCNRVFIVVWQWDYSCCSSTGFRPSSCSTVCYSGVTGVSQWCYSGVTLVL
jgi:hypothetical protein